MGVGGSGDGGARARRPLSRRPHGPAVALLRRAPSPHASRRCCTSVPCSRGTASLRGWTYPSTYASVRSVGDDGDPARGLIPPGVQATGGAVVGLHDRRGKRRFDRERLNQVPVSPQTSACTVRASRRRRPTLQLRLRWSPCGPSRADVHRASHRAQFGFHERGHRTGTEAPGEEAAAASGDRAAFGDPLPEAGGHPGDGEHVDQFAGSVGKDSVLDGGHTQPQVNAGRGRRRAVGN